MAAKKKTSLGPKVRMLLEQALLEALKRHIDSKGRKSPAAARKKKTGKKKISRRPAKKRARKTATRRRARR
ncbi:MAG TPA: hypothetical protein VGM47_06940 [Gammaproteobacteria bacterium]|jgi:hypothetical protein